jgi:hypothetical protein
MTRTHADVSRAFSTAPPTRSQAGGAGPTTRRVAATVATTVALGLLAGACTGAAGGTAVMGSSRVTPGQLAGWFHTKGSGGSATTPVEWLAYFFVTEGAAEGVAGDLAFVQAMVETGWLRFSARMPRDANNFSGIGAVDGGSGAAWFPTAQLGVRAQIQHLKAYADPTADPSTLANPLIDPRFHLVNRGIAPTWEQFGNGIWATDPGYAGKIQRLRADLLAYATAHPEL